MPTDVIMPALGVSQETGTLLRWFKREGESVVQGEPLMEVETDKATVEIESPASGVLSKVTAKPGDEVPVGQPIGIIVSPGESAADHVRPDRRLLPASPTGHRKKPSMPKPGKIAQQVPSGRIPASPAARRIAREIGVDLSTVQGSGPEGSITARDVLRSAEPPAPSSGSAVKVEKVLPLTRMKRIVGDRMARSKQNAPHIYLSMDVDMTEVNRKRNEWKGKGEGIVPSINDFILWASARALRAVPELNSSLTDKGVEIYSDINIGMAVALEEGLVVPVVRNADAMTLLQVARISRELTDKAQAKKLSPPDFEGGTFTVSNLGMFGVSSFTAIINPPQCAILAVGEVGLRAVPSEKGIEARHRMTLTLSADHRIVDGAAGARFLREVKRLLEHPRV